MINKYQIKIIVFLIISVLFKTKESFSINNYKSNKNSFTNKLKFDLSSNLVHHYSEYKNDYLYSLATLNQGTILFKFAKIELGCSVLYKNINKIYFNYNNGVNQIYSVLIKKNYFGGGFLLRKNFELKNRNTFHIQNNLTFTNNLQMSLQKNAVSITGQILQPDNNNITSLLDCQNLISFGTSSQIDEKVRIGWNAGLSFYSFKLNVPGIFGGVFIVLN